MMILLFLLVTKCAISPDRFAEVLAANAASSGYAAAIGISEIAQRNNALLFYMASPSLEMISALSGKFKGRVFFSSLDKPYISVKLQKNEKPASLIREVIDFIAQSE